MASNQVDVKAVITAEDKASGVVDNFANSTQKATTRIAAAMTVAGAGLTLYAKSATDYTVELTKNTKQLSRETGLTAESASALLYVTQRMGVTADQASQSFGIFSKKIAETASATDASQTSLGKLGIQVKDANGYTKTFNDILLQTADVFAKMPDGPQKSAAAMELFGRAGKDMIPVLNLGSQGIKDLEAQAQKLGLTLTSQNVADVQKYINATKNLTDANNALKIQIGQLTAPVLASLQNKLASVITTVISASGPFKGVAAAAIALGGPMLSLGGSALAAGANMAQILPILARLAPALLAAAPYVLAVGAVVGAGAVAWKLWKDRTENAGQAADKAEDAQRKMNTTLQNQVTTLQDVTAATRDFTRAQLDVTGASLSVERAQRDYNDAVKNYGPNSLEAREAAYQLQRAQFDLQDATQKASDAQATLNQKQAEMSIQAPGAAAAIDLVISHINGIPIAADGAITKVGDLSLRIGQTLSQSINATSAIQGQFSNLQGAANTVQVAVNSVQTTANNLQNTINNLNTSGSRGIPLNINVGGKGIPLRARGGPVAGGEPYIVGENAPELFVPRTAGDIIPMDKLGGVAPAPAAAGGGKTEISISVNAGAFMGSQNDARKYAMQIWQALQDIAASRNTTVAKMVGA